MGYFDSDTVLLALSITEITGMCLVATSALMYILFVWVIRMTNFNIVGFTINYCFAALLFVSFYLCYYGLTFLNDYYTLISANGCNYLFYFSIFANCSVVYTFGGISINRLCMVVFNTKRIFKTNKWVIASITVSWIVTVAITLPCFLLDHTVSLAKKQQK